MGDKSLTVRQSSWKNEDLATVCGIANAGGGQLFIATSRKDYNTGMRKLRKTFESIPSITLRDLGIACTTEPVMDGSKLCLSINIPRPDSALSYFGKYYLYSNGSNQTVSRETVERALENKGGASWETQIQPNMQRSDIDPDILKAMANIDELSLDGKMHSQRLVAETLDSYGLIDSVTDSITNIGVLLLDKRPHDFIPGAVIRVGRFDSAGSHTGDYDIVEGPITKQLVSTLELLRNKYHVIGHIDADNTGSYIPEKAMHEALLNALVHKDYSSGIAISINIYPEKVYVENVGRPPADWTAETLLERHSSRPNNPILATALHKSELFNGWGNGIEIIRKTCEHSQSCTPYFVVNSDETIVQFELDKPSVSETSSSAEHIGQAIIERLNKATGQTEIADVDNVAETTATANSTNERYSDTTLPDTESVDSNSNVVRKSYRNVQGSSTNSKFSETSFAAANDIYLTSTDEYVLKVLGINGRATATWIADVLGVSESTVRRSFKKLRDMGIIERVGSKKAGYWKVLL